MRAVRITMMEMVMRKRARTAPMMAPATVMEFDLSAWDWPGTEQRHTCFFSQATRSDNELTPAAEETGYKIFSITFGHLNIREIKMTTPQSFQFH